MMALNSIMVKMRLKMYDWVTSANQRDKIMLLSKTTVFMRLTFSNILFMYCCGPFQKARPISAAITAMVKIHTNFPGDVTIEKMFMMLILHLEYMTTLVMFEEQEANQEL